MPDIFNTNAQPDLAAPTGQIDARALMQLAQLGQQPATRQPASTGMQATQPAGQINPTTAQLFGAQLGKWMRDYQAKMQQYGGGQGQQPQAPPATWNVTPQQPGPPMNIVPQGYGYR